MNQLVDTEAASSQAGVVAAATPQAHWRGALVVRTAWVLLGGVALGLFAVGLPGLRPATGQRLPA